MALLVSVVRVRGSKKKVKNTAHEHSHSFNNEYGSSYGEETVYFEMGSRQATAAGLFDDLVEGSEIPGTEQTSRNVAEKNRQISTESEAMMIKRL